MKWQLDELAWYNMLWYVFERGAGVHEGGGGGDLEWDFVTCIQFVKMLTWMWFILGVCECSVGYVQKCPLFPVDHGCFSVCFSTLYFIVAETLNKKYYRS